MQKRYLIPQHIVVSLITCFLLFSPPFLKDQLIQSTALAGNQGWSDAFGTPSGKSSPSPRKPASSGGGWNTVIEDDRYNPIVYEKKKTKKSSPPQPQKQPQSHTAEAQITPPTRPAVLNLIDSLLASNQPAKIAPAVYINNMTTVQYAGAVSMAKEGTRIFYGKMDTEQERLFDARWLPIFRYPSQEIVSYLNQLNPLLVQFLALRASLNNSIEDFNATQFEVMVTTQIGDAYGVSEAMESAVIYAMVIKVLNARLQLVAKEIIALGEPPNAIALMRRARKEHEEAFKEFSKKPDLVKQGCWTMVECRVKKKPKPHVTYLIDKKACRIECKYAPPPPHKSISLLNRYNYIHTWKAPPQRLFLGSRVQISVSVKNPRENTFRYLSPKEVKKLENRPGSSDKYFNYCYCKNNHEATASIGIWWNLTYEDNKNLALPYETSHFPEKGIILATTSITEPENQALSDPMTIENFQKKYYYKDRLLWLDIGVRNSCYEYKNTGGNDGNETENSANVIYAYKWDPTGGDLEPLDLGEKFAQASAEPLKVSDQNQEEIDPKIAAQNRAEKIIFHQHNIDHFNRNIKTLTKDLANAKDLKRREHLHRDLLYAKDARQRELDAITTIKTGNYVRTRTELDAHNLKIMAEQSLKMAAKLRHPKAKRSMEVGLRLIRLAPRHQRPALMKFYYRNISINKDPEKRSAATKTLGDMVLSLIGVEIEAHQEEAQYWNENLEMAQITKSSADTSLMLLSLGGMGSAALCGETALITASGITHQVYGAATGYFEGGIGEGVRRFAAFFNTATIIIDAGMRGYESGVLQHLEEYAQNPQKIALDEEKAGFKGAAWSAGKAAAFSVAMRFGMKTLNKIRIKKQLRHDQAVHGGRMRYHENRIADAEVKIRLFEQRLAALAKAGKAGASKSKLLKLKADLEHAYIDIKTDVFAKLKMKAIGKQADYRSAAGTTGKDSHKVVNAYNKMDRNFTKKLIKTLDKRMGEAGFSKQRYKTFSNSSSKGKVGMDVDIGIDKEPPRYIMNADNKIIPNKAHTKWRNNLTHTVNGKTNRISPHEFQKAGHKQLKAAFKDVYGREPGEAMVEFTTSYHPEAYRDINWLGGKPGVYSTDRNWTQQAADVTDFKVNNLGRDHPSLGYYGNMQESCRGLVKDMDTKLEPMLRFCKNPKAVKHMKKIKTVMEQFSTNEIGPVDAERRLKMLTGNTDGVKEISQRFSVMLQGLRNQVPN
ncbi:MAG: hypothetical protein U9Q39_02145, partial [Pseudomonadota bacterium]|nr:hypothetical protein [Pseudomonadota bacterium]